MPNPKKPRPACKQCGKEVNLPVAIYCSLKCQHQWYYEEYIRRWKAGEVSGEADKNGLSIARRIRRYLIERDGEQCSSCGWNKRNPVTGRVPLEVDHINGNNQDHSEDNLRL